MKSMMVLNRSAAETPRMAKRERRQESPAKNEEKKSSKDDSEPATSGAPGAASPRVVPAAREKRTGAGRSGPDRLPGERCRDRVDESEVSQEYGAHRRAFLPHDGAAEPAAARLADRNSRRIPRRYWHLSCHGAALREKIRADTFPR